MISLYDVILSVSNTEKSVRLSDKYKQFTLRVAFVVNKFLIKRSVEHLFNVKVSKVRIIISKGKKKTYKKTNGVRSSYKKCIVFLKKGYDINFSEFT